MTSGDLRRGKKDVSSTVKNLQSELDRCDYLIDAIYKGPAFKISEQGKCLGNLVKVENALVYAEVQWFSKHAQRFMVLVRP